MPDPTKRSGDDIKNQVLIILRIYEEGCKDKYPNDPYFDGYRAALKSVKGLVQEIKLEQ